MSASSDNGHHSSRCFGWRRRTPSSQSNCSHRGFSSLPPFASAFRSSRPTGLLLSHILVIRQLAAGEQAKLLEIIDQVGDVPVTCPSSWIDEVPVPITASRPHAPTSRKTRGSKSHLEGSPATPDCSLTPSDHFKDSRNTKRSQLHRAGLPIFGGGH